MMDRLPQVTRVSTAIQGAARDWRMNDFFRRTR
jgi:hypothetical protein